MKYTLVCRVFGHVLAGFLKEDARTKPLKKGIMKEYKAILLRAKNIGESNPLLGSYALAAFYIAMNRVGPCSPQENYEIIDKGIRQSRLPKLLLGDADGYLDEKRTAKRVEWSKETHQKKYENDWVVDIIPKSENYDLGYDYLECGVCKLCRDENCFELAHYMCMLDFLLFEIIGLKLDRTTTLADGGEKCDFRFKRI